MAGMEWRGISTNVAKSNEVAGSRKRQSAGKDRACKREAVGYRNQPTAPKPVSTGSKLTLFQITPPRPCPRTAHYRSPPHPPQPPPSPTPAHHTPSHSTTRSSDRSADPATDRPLRPTKRPNDRSTDQSADPATDRAPPTRRTAERPINRPIGRPIHQSAVRSTHW